MLRRIVVGVKGLEKDHAVLEFVTALASESGSGVLVVHVRERRCSKAGPCYAETMDEASCLVEEAVFGLRMAGIGASGTVTRSLDGRAAESILEQAQACAADAIVLGWHERRGLRRLLRTGDRERLLRHSKLPVILAPVRPSQRQSSGAEVLTARSDTRH